MNNKNKLIIPLYDDALAVLFDIEEKYGMQNNQDDWTKNEKIIVDSSRNLVLKKITQREFTRNIKSNLKTSENIDAIINDILNKFIPLLTPITEEQRQQNVIEMRNKNIESKEKEAEAVIKLKSPIGVLNSLKQEMQREEIGIIPEIESEPEATLPFEEAIKPVITQPKIEPKPAESEEKAPTQKSKADNYREPVE